MPIPIARNKEKLFILYLSHSQNVVRTKELNFISIGSVKQISLVFKSITVQLFTKFWSEDVFFCILLMWCLSSFKFNPEFSKYVIEYTSPSDNLWLVFLLFLFVGKL